MLLKEQEGMERRSESSGGSETSAGGSGEAGSPEERAVWQVS